MTVEEQRYLSEDLERLEQGIAERMSDEPKLIRDRLNRDHEVSQLLDQVQKQSKNLISIYRDVNGERAKEMQQIGSGDPFESFYRQVGEIRDHHAKYQNEQAENSEIRYRPKRAGDGAEPGPSMVDLMFSGEEAFGRYMDMHTNHEEYVNLPNVKRLTYLQYLEVFDDFTPGAGGVKRAEKLTDQYLRYVGNLTKYVESFMRRTRPLENLEKLFATWDKEFDEAWEKDEVPNWEVQGPSKTNGTTRQLSNPEAVWCDDCEKEFKNENVYRGHLSGRKHVKAAELRAANSGGMNGTANGAHGTSTIRLKERAIAEREYRVKRLAGAMSTERDDTRVNVERRQVMTEKERAQELEDLYNSTQEAAQAMQLDVDDAEDGDEKIWNPLRLPLAWDGKPIPFWLYRLHGLGQEFPCEICGNYVYMGRRAYDRHFQEARHTYGLKCLGVNSTTLFRDISSIDQALKLWEKVQRDKRKEKVDEGTVVQMEDGEGNVMPEKVYYDLQKQGLL